MNLFQDLFDRQKRHFATGVTRSFTWRTEQLDRMARLVGENEAALQRAVGQDFKTASQEQVFETLACRARSRSRRASSRIGWRRPRRPCRGRSPPPGIAVLSIAIRTAWRSLSVHSMVLCSCCSARQLLRWQPATAACSS